MFFLIFNPKLLCRCCKLYNLYTLIGSEIRNDGITEHNYTTLLNVLKKSGPVIIKLMQWIVSRPYVMGHFIKTTNDINFYKFKELQNNCIPDYNNFIYNIKKIKTINLDLTKSNVTLLGVGSVGQVYKYKNFVIKSINTNKKELIKQDITLINYYKKYFNNDLSNILNSIDIDNFFSELYQQTDLIYETNYLNIIKTNLKDLDFIIIPTIIYSSSNILIETYHKGLTPDEVKLEYPKLYKKCRILSCIAFLKMIDTGLVHSDLHDGNILYNINNNNIKVILIDFGMVIKLTPDEIINVKKIIKNICIISFDMQKEYLNELINILFNNMITDKILNSIKIKLLKIFIIKKDKNLIDANKLPSIYETLIEYSVKHNIIINYKYIQLLIIFCQLESDISSKSSISFFKELLDYLENNNLNYLETK